MYYAYFGFASPPFSIAPDPRYLYLSQKHNEAIAHLNYGLLNQSGGFVLLTGEIGAGKTTVCRAVLDAQPEDCDVALIYNPRLTIEEMLATICDELHIRYPRGTKTVKPFVERINKRLLESHADGRKTVLIIDEAQNLANDVLEQLRLLTNLETNERKLLQIILLGQPELNARLAQQDMTQLAQRIIARYHLNNLTAEDVASYVQHRLSIAGVTRRLFPDTVIGRIYRRTKGNPRLINVVCDRALLGAYVQGLDVVDIETAESAMDEVLGRKSFWPVRVEWLDRWLRGGTGRAVGVGAFLVALLVAGLAMFDRPAPTMPTAYTALSQTAQAAVAVDPATATIGGPVQMTSKRR